MRNKIASLWLLLAAGACSADSSSNSGYSKGSQPVTSGTFGNATSGGRMQPGPTDEASRRGLCDIVHLNATPSTPDVMIVLDRSASMGLEGRWIPSANAVRTIVNGLQAQIRFGLAMFPDPDVSGTGVQIDATPCLSDPDPFTCLANLLADAGVAVNTAVANMCAPGKVVVPVGLNTAMAIGDALNATLPGGGTPTPETLQGLLDQFAPVNNNPDVTPRPKYVLLVTDGQPTCPNGGGMQTNDADVTASNAAIEALTARGVHTYVIGYNTTGAGNETVAAVLDGFAVRGGTGDMHHRPVENEQGLLAEFQRIAGNLISCTFVLDKAPARAEYVLVRVDGQQVNLNDANGWHLSDARTVELVGGACESLQRDGDHAVDVEVRCEVVQPQ